MREGTENHVIFLLIAQIYESSSSETDGAGHKWNGPDKNFKRTVEYTTAALFLNGPYSQSRKDGYV